MTIRPRRSALYMPGANARALEKAKTLPCDAVILDLEDAVAPDAKAAARDQVMAAVAARRFGAREVIMRVNGLDTPWWRDDLQAAATAAPDGVLVPKVSKPADLQTVTARLADIAPGHRILLWAMIETPLAIINAADIAAVARDGETRLAGFMMGINDLAKETRARQMDGRTPMVSWLATAVLAAHAHGIDILDGVYNDIHDVEGFRRECVQGRDMGFDGKTLVHPNQIAPCNAAFSPTLDEIDQARRIIAVFELPENRTKGVVQLDGRMVERMHADIARRTVAIADAIAARSQPRP
jgi:citrate lyase subunit beta/citryl-CoA lyase